MLHYHCIEVKIVVFTFLLFYLFNKQLQYVIDRTVEVPSYRFVTDGSSFPCFQIVMLMIKIFDGGGFASCVAVMLLDFCCPHNIN